MLRLICGCLAATLTSAVVAAAPVPKSGKPIVGETNTGALITKHRDKLKLKASTEWDGYSVSALFDGDPKTPWYSRGGDAPQSGMKPTITVTFPADVSVKRVTVLGNRDPNFPDGYSVLEGTIELLDTNDKVISKHELKATGDHHDFDLILSKYTTLRAVKFTMTKDQKKFNCVGLGEFQVE